MPQQTPKIPDSLTGSAAVAQTLEDLAELLRALRRRHARANRDSRLTYRELAQRTGWSQAAIAEYFTARALAPTDRLDALLAILGADPAELRALADARDRVEENRRRAKTSRAATASAPATASTPAVPATDSASTAHVAAVSNRHGDQPRPRQLPAGTALFTGRDREIEHLSALAERTMTSTVPGVAVISAIDGMGGVGKTALALHAAHRLAERFPDGQLFVDLYGFTREGPPRDPGDALAELLGALGVPPGRIPAQPQARAALYRDHLAGTRTLVVLDNAWDEAQVRPLLPASAGCLVLVTSRKRLKALDDAVPLPLDMLPPDEAVALLRRSAHARREPADEAQWERVAELCGRLPLALVIAGAVLRTGGEAWNLARLIDRLAPRSADGELTGYTDETRSVAAVFDLSYQRLSDHEQLLFRRLGLLPGPEIDAYAAAALLDTDPGSADLLVQRLADQSLLTGISPGRYRLHDLIRAHARTLGTAHDSEPERATALDRLLDYYAHTAQRASIPIARQPPPAPTGPAPAYAPDLPSAEAARTWLRVEYRNLEAAYTHADARAADRHTIALAAGLAELLFTEGPWTRAIEIHQTAAEAAGRRSELAAQAAALNNLGRVRCLAGGLSGAAEDLTRALEIYRKTGDRRGEAAALNNLGRVWLLAGERTEAADVYALALEICREIGNRLGEAIALNNLGQLRHSTGDHPAAAKATARALEIYRQIDDRRGEAAALNNLGRIMYITGDYPAALDIQAQALEIHRQIGDRPGEANTLNYLGQARTITGDYAGAAQAQAQALQLYRTIGNRLGEANVLAGLGRVRYVTGDFPGAGEAQAAALNIYRQMGNRPNEAWVLNHYAASIAATGDRPRALALYQQALAMNRELNKPDDEAISLEGIAEHQIADDDTTGGTAHLRLALDIYQHLGMREDAKRLQTRLDELGAAEPPS
jgi:tetratricopeptide (TPR) repeat protein/transcriptional regulator with XRE-family HTH domain